MNRIRWLIGPYYPLGMLAIAALALCISCTSCGGTVPQVVTRQEVPFMACVPTALPRLVACHSSPDEATCIVLEVASLVACWVGHPAPPATPPPTPIDARSILTMRRHWSPPTHREYSAPVTVGVTRRYPMLS